MNCQRSTVPGACLGVLFLEPVYPSCSIDKLLLTCVKRMALGADFNMDFFPDTGLGFKLVSTGAAYLGVAELGMDIFFHYKPPNKFKDDIIYIIDRRLASQFA
jgi:hypothetical protein